MDINFVEYLNIIIVLACLLVGFIVKKWVKDVDNKLIPTIVFVLGVALQFLVKGVSVENFVIGGISGLASTGLHQLFTQFIDKSAE